MQHRDPQHAELLAQAKAQADAVVEEDAEGLRRVRERLFHGRAAQPRRSRRWQWAAASGALALAAVIALAIWLDGREPPHLASEAPRQTEPRAGEEWIAAPEDAELPVQFADGAEVVLAPRSDFTVVHRAPNGARVRLGRGAARVDVPHEDGAPHDWQVLAGPFEVVVRGTEFEVEWEPEAAHFTLQMHRGEVELRGPMVDGRAVRDERVEVWVREGRLEVVSTQSGETEAEAEVEPASNEQASSQLEEPVDPVSAPPRDPVAGELVEMDSLGRAGRYDEAVAIAERVGWSDVLRRSTAERALRLGDSARYAGRLDRAEETYRAVRARYPGTPAAAEAAFHLGRLAADQQGDPAAASHWLEVYVRDARDGRFIREAHGRLLEIEHRSGRHARARELAAEYLERFGDESPYSELARQITVGSAD